MRVVLKLNPGNLGLLKSEGAHTNDGRRLRIFLLLDQFQGGLEILRILMDRDLISHLFGLWREM